MSKWITLCLGYSGNRFRRLCNLGWMHDAWCMNISKIILIIISKRRKHRTIEKGDLIMEGSTVGRASRKRVMKPYDFDRPRDQPTSFLRWINYSKSLLRPVDGWKELRYIEAVSYLFRIIRFMAAGLRQIQLDNEYILFWCFHAMIIVAEKGEVITLLLWINKKNESCTLRFAIQ